MKSLLALTVSILIVSLLAGCNSAECAKLQDAYNKADGALVGSTNALTAQQEFLATLPPNDPIRVSAAGPLAKLAAAAAEAQVAATLAKVAIASACPAIVTTAPATQPSK